MPVRHLKKIPADHPIHRGLIIFGRKLRDSSEPQETEASPLRVDRLCD